MGSNTSLEAGRESRMVDRVSQSITRASWLIILLTSGSMVIGDLAMAEMPIGPFPNHLLFGISVLYAGAAWGASKIYARRRARAVRDVEVRDENQLTTLPIQDLSQKIRDISTGENYSVRLPEPSTEALALVVEPVNALLERMEKQGQHARGEGFRLECAVTERTKKLKASEERFKATAAEAVAENEAHRRFTANMIHEVRTPMNGVMGMSELLLNTDMTPDQMRYTTAIRGSAEDLLSIVNNILDFSRIEAGKLQRIDYEAFSPTDCVGRVCELLTGRARQRGLELSCESADDVPGALLGDGKRLRQVLTNIVGNALKFTDHGTIVIRTTLVEAGDDVSTVRFEVVDTGIGVSAHLHEHVFEGFSQADASTTRQFQGTGLGLAISKHLVELMGGEIGLISKPGVGSNFWFTVKGEHNLSKTPTDHDLSGVRALIVAAEDEGGSVLLGHLNVCGAEGVVVPSAEEALSAIQLSVREQQPFEVVLIDAGARHGLAVAGQMSEGEEVPSVPLVLVSTIERAPSELRKAGLARSLRKPVTEETLFDCVAKVTKRLAVTVAAEAELTQSEVLERVAGARVLVAEDNPVNQDVAKTMLETLKCQVDVVPDGAQAIDAVQRESYDLVLLDCEMPTLDGYEATAQIRQLVEEGKVRTEGTVRCSGHLPIVALTAHTAPANRERSLESGVDDFVSKPFTFQTMRNLLAHWIGGQEASLAPPPLAADAGRGHDAPGDIPADGPISEAALAQILELDRLNGGGLFARLVHSFLETTPETLDQLRAAIREDDADGVARAAHELRSASFNVAAERMAHASKDVEALGRSGTTDGAAELMAKLDDLFSAVQTELEARLERQGREESVSADA